VYLSTLFLFHRYTSAVNTAHTSLSCLCSSCSDFCDPIDFNRSTQYRNLWELLRDYMDYAAVIQTSGISRNFGIVRSPWMLQSFAYILWSISTNCPWILKINTLLSRRNITLQNVAVELVGFERSRIKISAQRLAMLTEVIANLLSPQRKLRDFNWNWATNAFFYILSN